jgi:hypothetical protein
MNIRVTVTEDDGTWRGQLTLEPGGMTQTELASLAAHGAFELDAGGDFSGTGLTDTSLDGINFELEENLVMIPTDLPVIQEFDPLDSVDVEMGARAAIWAERMLERLTTTLEAWLDLSENYQRDTIHTIP